MKGYLMQREYTAIVKQDGEWWIGWIEEVPGVNCQERTRDELIETLRLTLQEALDFNRDEARSAAGSDYSEVKIGL
jgi:predicted RNase H-like HicB family nuclease